MSRFRIVLIMAVSWIGIGSTWAPETMAQGPDVASATADTQMQKDQRAADRKARREKKNAELRTLKKNGYQPGEDQLHYPQNIENAQQKANSQKAGEAASTSAP
jgi:hypothetical protein